MNKGHKREGCGVVLPPHYPAWWHCPAGKTRVQKEAEIRAPQYTIEYVKAETYGRPIVAVDVDKWWRTLRAHTS